MLTVVQVIWLNIVLSGDNAVIIALACRQLPVATRRVGMIAGAAIAIILRIICTIMVVTLLETPFIKLVGSLLLFWIAVKLLADEQTTDDDKVTASEHLWHAIRIIVMADIVMSLDNVLAIAAVAKDNTSILILGLLLSIPIIVAGASVIVSLLERLPILVWAGAALLGWVAAEMLIGDPAVLRQIGDSAYTLRPYLLPFGAAFVLVAGFVMRRRAHASP